MGSLLDRLRQITGMVWTERRAAPGVTEYERTSPHVTVLTNTQSCHLHYWTTDEALEKQGWAKTDLVCHACQEATRVLWPDPGPIENDPTDGLGIPTLRTVREGFEHDHRNHVALGNAVLCPPGYVVTETRDLR
jgi:hypothetical protein